MLHNLKCPSCNRQFLSNHMKTYCSNECASYERTKREGDNRKAGRLTFYQENPIVCQCCEKSFIRTHGLQRYCDDTCRLKGRLFKFVTAQKVRRKIAKSVLSNKRATIEDMEVLGK